MSREMQSGCFTPSSNTEVLGLEEDLVLGEVIGTDLHEHEVGTTIDLAQDDPPVCWQRRDDNSLEQLTLQLVGFQKRAPPTGSRQARSGIL